MSRHNHRGGFHEQGPQAFKSMSLKKVSKRWAIVCLVTLIFSLVLSCWLMSETRRKIKRIRAEYYPLLEALSAQLQESGSVPKDNLPASVNDLLSRLRNDPRVIVTRVAIETDPAKNGWRDFGFAKSKFERITSWFGGVWGDLYLSDGSTIPITSISRFGTLNGYRTQCELVIDRR